MEQIPQTRIGDTQAALLNQAFNNNLLKIRYRAVTEYTVGMWMYSNGGGETIQAKIVSKLRERGVSTITDLNLANATVQRGVITFGGVVTEELDAFFSYNARQQTP